MTLYYARFNKKLLVLEQLPKPANFGGAPPPVSMGGTFTLKRILGTVAVEPDGSAYFEVPALRSLFLVALDADDLSVKRMQSYVTLQPGEVSACAGCHENRTDSPRMGRHPVLMAAGRQPSRIDPIKSVPDILDFPRDVQPILDHHCLKCHDYDQRRGGVILSGDRGPWFSHTYATLTLRKQFTDGRNDTGNKAPRTIGTSASPLMSKISGGHHDVKVSPHERDVIRCWIESGAAYPGTYGALGTGVVDVVPLKDVVERRCAICHDAMPLDAELLYNLSRPEKSMLLLAPLAREAGGYGLCKAKPAEGGGPVFASASDPDYRSLLEVVAAASQALKAQTRFDMPGFRPRGDYVREMKRYGLLPSTIDPRSAPVLDPYELDRAYWRSFWYQPAPASQADTAPEHGSR